MHSQNRWFIFSILLNPLESKVATFNQPLAMQFCSPMYEICWCIRFTAVPRTWPRQSCQNQIILSPVVCLLCHKKGKNTVKTSEYALDCWERTEFVFLVGLEFRLSIFYSTSLGSWIQPHFNLWVRVEMHLSCSSHDRVAHSSSQKAFQT